MAFRFLLLSFCCVYYKNILRFKLFNIKYLQKCILIEQRKCCKFICFYRSPSQTNDKLESFLKIFELTLGKIHEEKPFMISTLGNFKSNDWFKNHTTSTVVEIGKN